MSFASDRKLLSCPTCADKKWHRKLERLVYRCTACGNALDLATVKRDEKRQRDTERRFKQEPKPRKKRPTRKIRLIDKPFVAFIHDWPCIVPGCERPWPVHAHHSIPRGRGGSDRTCIPLCHRHHADYHDKIGSIEAAEKEWGIDVEAATIALNAAFDAGRQGPYHGMEP